VNDEGIIDDTWDLLILCMEDVGGGG
jgi:hypothetical protein